MKKKTKIILSASVLLMAILLTVTAVIKVDKFRARAEYYRELAYVEKSWIMENQLPDGAIAHTDISDIGTEQLISPYFSATAVRGLLAGSVSPQQAAAAERWLNWYLDRLNTEQEDSLNGDGTIYDYILNMENGQISMESTGNYDSVDSYAALFLIALEEYCENCGTELLEKRFEDVERVIEAMLRTVEANGLSIAKQEYKMQYLMDNSELNRGIKAAIELLKLSGGNQELLHKLDKILENNEKAFEKYFWNEEAQCYDIAVYKGDREKFGGWDKFYPDGAAQLFPALFEVSAQDKERGSLLYSSFCSSWNWQELEHMESGATDFYWGILACAAAVQGDEERLDAYLNSYLAELKEKGRAYPLYTGEAGWVCQSCGIMEDYFNNTSALKVIIKNL